MTKTLGSLLAIASTMNPSGGVIATDSRLYAWPELDERAHQLASCLVAHGVSPGDRVAVLHPKSVWSFLAVHAVIRCGAVMVPLDPLGPKDSVQQVLDACDPTAIIGAAKTLAGRAHEFIEQNDVLVVASGEDEDVAALGLGQGRCIALERALETDATVMPAIDADDPAYIIFTSGSTGEPKGITHTHRSAMAYVQNAQAIHGLATNDRVAGTSPLHFDMSTLELYVTPYSGASAVTVSEVELRFPASLSRRLAETEVTIVYAVPYQLRQLCLRGDIANQDLSALRQVSFGGEQFAPGVLAELAASFPAAELLNVYGPAEVNGIASQSWPPRTTHIEEVPIGVPWPGVSIRIVEPDLKEVEPGGVGELVASCPSQMVGYWKRPTLNAQCFVTIDEQRWYRTGDLVRQDARGCMHFIGRSDTRVKVRGVRLELETIETLLSDMPGINSAVVGVREDQASMQHVVAWLLPTSRSAEITLPDVRRWCRDRLPDSAVPTELRIVQDFAMSRTGKIDRKSLRESLIETEESTT